MSGPRRAGPAVPWGENGQARRGSGRRGLGRCLLPCLRSWEGRVWQAERQAGSEGLTSPLAEGSLSGDSQASCPDPPPRGKPTAPCLLPLPEHTGILSRLSWNGRPSSGGTWSVLSWERRWKGAPAGCPSSCPPCCKGCLAHEGLLGEARLSPAVAQGQSSPGRHLLSCGLVSPPATHPGWGRTPKAGEGPLWLEGRPGMLAMCPAEAA